MKLNPDHDAGRLQVALFVAGLLVSLGTALISLNVKAEVMETRVLLLEKISEAGKQYTSRPEFEQLRERVNHLEMEHRQERRR
ncbi:MAG: hypothetical protein KatS3mg005_4154 [Bryobacteraceae bacterium]|nr:MAG: hypothetical protein KatS3mg005_4154 [Bryobacteraceae bacterium]